eukprot:9448010-Ditylum_brightwellii.AAC.1
MKKLKKGKKNSQVVLSKNLYHMYRKKQLLERAKNCAMVDIIDELCDNVEHSKLQSIVNDK